MLLERLLEFRDLPRGRRHVVLAEQAEHTLNIDFLDPGAGPSARVAVELTAESARALAKAIEATLDSAPPGLVT